jgi:hypothetical protein
MVDAILNELLNASRDHSDGDEPGETLQRATRAFILRSRAYPPALRAAAESLQTLPPAGAAWVAVAIGAVIEGSPGVELSAPPLIECFLSWLPQLPVPSAADIEGEDDPKPTPEQEPWVAAFPELCRAVVSHLARMPELRAKLAADQALLDRLAALEHYTIGAAWVREMLMRSCGTLIVLHPPSAIGLRVRYNNVAACFHLFSLLQTAIGTRIPGGREPDALVSAVARGKKHEKVMDHAWWHYGDPRSKTADVRKPIWGEALVRTIPIVNDQQVMLLWPPILRGRSWDSSFFGPHLEALAADVVIEEKLSRHACHEWFEALGVRENAPRRKWWWPW